VRALMRDELAPTLTRAAALDPATYQASLWPRFANAALGHATQQVAMDTSAKLAQRHVPALLERRQRGQSIAHLAMVVAGWIRYLAGRDEKNTAYVIDDPLATALGAIALTWRANPHTCVARIFAVEAVFGALRDDALAQEAVAGQLERIAALGVRAALRAV
jgi:fructuronate reductase